MRGKCKLKLYQPDKPLGRVERVNTLGTCRFPSKMWANSLLLLDLRKPRSFL